MGAVAAGAVLAWITGSPDPLVAGLMCGVPLMVTALVG